jgi:hypothetical protein
MQISVAAMLLTPTMIVSPGLVASDLQIAPQTTRHPPLFTSRAARPEETVDEETTDRTDITDEEDATRIASASSISDSAASPADKVPYLWQGEKSLVESQLHFSICVPRSRALPDLSPACCFAEA